MPLNKVDEHLLRLAKATGSKSSLERTKRGAVLARGNKVLAVGASTHLGEGKVQTGQLVENERYIATLRAEMVCIGNAIKAGLNLTGTTIYVSDHPDWFSFKLIVTMGINRIVFYGPLQSERTQHYANLLGIEIVALG